VWFGGGTPNLPEKIFSCNYLDFKKPLGLLEYSVFYGAKVKYNNLILGEDVLSPLPRFFLKIISILF